MDYDFRISQEALRIPSSVYKPVKRCPFCQSVYINEKFCDTCERSLSYDPVGEPFSAKSFYGLKERYVEKLDAIVRFFPVFEDKKSPEAKSYVRKLEKRFSDLISAFNTVNSISSLNNRKLFYAESMELIDELLNYHVHPSLIEALLLENDNSLAGQELLLYLQNSILRNKPTKNWQDQFLDYRVLGVLRMEFCLKTLIISATVFTMAVQYKDIISSQFGR